MFKTILAIIISVTFLGVLFFIIVRNLLKRKLDQLVEDEKKKEILLTKVSGDGFFETFLSFFEVVL